MTGVTQRMSEVESLMWRLESDPLLSSSFANLTLLDRMPDLGVLRRRLERASYLIPHLRQRVQPAPGNLVPPAWVDDTDFDLDRHLRVVRLPDGAGRDGLLRLAADVAARPFDRTRPLWEFVVVDGLPGGQAAMIQKLHHTITDGERGIRLSMQFLDVERDAPEPPPLDPEAPVPAHEPSPPPTPLDLAREVLDRGLAVPRALAGEVGAALVDPGRLPRTAAGALATARGVVANLTETAPARSPLWTSRSAHRRVEILQVPLEDVKAAARELGGSLNTAFLTAAAAAAGAYHRAFAAPVEQLRVSMAISTRTAGSGTNAFSLARFDAPTGELDVRERFALVKERTEVARASGTVGGVDALARLASALPTPVITHLARQQAATVDFATSNVRAAPFVLYVAGAEILANHPIGPTGGVAFNLTLMSYRGGLDLGINVDAAAVAEPGLLRIELERAFAELIAVAA